MRIALIGDGRWAQNHKRILNQSNRISDLQIFDSLCPPPNFADFDAVFITASSSAHAAYLRTAFILATPVYCEKPICIDSTQLAFIDVVRRPGQIFSAGFQLMYMPELLQRKKGAKLTSFASFRTGAIPRDEGAILSLLVHDLSILSMFVDLNQVQFSVSGSNHEAMVYMSSPLHQFSASLFVSSFSQARARSVIMSFSDGSVISLLPDNWNRIDLLAKSINTFLDAVAGSKTRILPSWDVSKAVMFLAFKIKTKIEIANG